MFLVSFLCGLSPPYLTKKILQLKEWDTALQAFTEVVQQEPEEGDAWANVAAIHMHRKNSAEAYPALVEVNRVAFDICIYIYFPLAYHLTTERLVITIRGIEELHPGNAAWEAVTANFIQEYFNLLLLKEELGVWDVSVALKVVKIESSASGGKSNSIFDRRRNDYLGLRSREDGE